jgi:hypothetical protein
MKRLLISALIVSQWLVASGKWQAAQKLTGSGKFTGSGTIASVPAPVSIQNTYSSAIYGSTNITASVSSGSKLYMHVVVSYDCVSNGCAPTNTSAITWNGTALSRYNSVGDPTNESIGVEHWYLANPATGSNGTVAVTESASINWGEVVVYVLTNAYQGAPNGWQPNASDTAATSSSITITSESGGLTIDGIVTVGTSSLGVTGSGQVLDAGGGSGSVGMSHTPGAASVKMSWSWTNSSGYTQGGCNINHA